MVLIRFEVFSPNVVGLGAAEGKDTEFAWMGKGDGTRCIHYKSVSFLGRKICIGKIGHILPLRYRRVLTLFQMWAIACLDLRTTITRTPQQIACRIVVIGPVRSGCKLRNELKVAQSISIYASLFCCVFGIFASVSMEIPNHNFLVCHHSVDLCVVHNKATRKPKTRRDSFIAKPRYNINGLF